MKDTAIVHSIGAALQACAEQVHADQIHADQVHAERQTVWPAASAVTAHSPQAPQPVHLTQRQLDVLALLCEGLPNKLICRRLNIAAGTVKVHIGCILRELGVTSRLQAVVAAGSLGLAGERIAAALEETVGAAGQPMKAAHYLEERASWRIAVTV